MAEEVRQVRLSGFKKVEWATLLPAPFLFLAGLQWVGDDDYSRGWRNPGAFGKDVPGFEDHRCDDCNGACESRSNDPLDEPLTAVVKIGLGRVLTATQSCHVRFDSADIIFKPLRASIPPS
ncbi:hypothetical protein [Massilia terrae]|uniref:Uncharacterized protein n=1 Tax=Massilia terrae TaxID=1811224 RepID=A0ABT2CR69_9BURK|nr:hypothetical protein [Massilia terrae]MCS0656471.1 hypothetical protein [Massilia terrae]